MSVLSISSKRLLQKAQERKCSMMVHLDKTESTTDNLSKPGIETRKEEKQLKKPLPKVKPPTPLERAGIKKRFVKKHYFSDGAKINEKNQRDILKEPSPFVYPKDLEAFSYKVMARAWRDNLRRKELKLKYNQRNSYRSRQELDQLNRLYVKEAEIKGLKTLKDVDPEFFSIVEGRPLFDNFKINRYIEDVRDVLRTKIVTGYKEDEIHLIEENLIQEQQIINKIKKEYQKYVDTFEEFLYEDHTSSMKLLRRSEVEARVAAEMYEHYRKLAKSYGMLKYSVYNLEEKWRTCKMYQKFLYLVSPIYWRRKYDYYHLERKDSHMSLATEVSTVFGRYRLPSTGDVLSLEDLVDQFLDDCKTQDDPILFFEQPKQLLKVFRFIEIQNLNTLLHIEELAIPTENVKEGIDNARLVFETEMNSLKEVVDSLEGGIVWEERRAEVLEGFAQELINGPFKELVAEEDVLNLYVFVEDVYEARVAPNDASISIAEMMKAIEMKFRSYVIQLDTLPQDQVMRAEAECFADYARIMKIAEEAAKKVVQIERLTRRLNKALQPPFEHKYRELKWRSPPVKIVKPPPPPPRPLTTQEVDFLTYFTEYCKQTDDLEEYGISLTDEKQGDKEKPGEEHRATVA